MMLNNIVWDLFNIKKGNIKIKSIYYIYNGGYCYEYVEKR